MTDTSAQRVTHCKIDGGVPDTGKTVFPFLSQSASVLHCPVCACARVSFMHHTVHIIIIMLRRLVCTTEGEFDCLPHLLN